MEALHLNTMRIVSLQNTTQTDDLGNLVHSYSDEYKASLRGLQEVRELGLQHQLLHDKPLQENVLNKLGDDVWELAEQLKLVKDDLDMQEIIVEFISDFPAMEQVIYDEQ
jgi:hypothetical protein